MPDIKNLIFHLTDLLNSWDVDEVSNDLQSNQSDFLYKEDLILFLATKINLVNTKNYNQFVCTTQFDIKEPKTYA